MAKYFSNWIIYVTVKVLPRVFWWYFHFSNWIIYVTVKEIVEDSEVQNILVTE